METAEVKLRIPKELKESLEAEAESKGLSLNAYIIDILKQRGKVTDVDLSKLLKPRWLMVTVPFNTKCAVCGGEIVKGESALWCKDTNINVCLECVRGSFREAFKAEDDLKKAFKAYKLYHKYAQLAKLAKRELDEALEMAEKYRYTEEIDEVARKLSEVLDLLRDYMVNIERDNKKLEEVLTKLSKIEAEWEDVKAALRLHLAKLLNKKEKKEVARW